MDSGQRHSWTLGRKLGLTAWVYVVSILINLGISSACLLLYFKPAFRDAEALFLQQQQVEKVRADIRRYRASAEHHPTDRKPSPDLMAASWESSKAVLDLDGSSAARSLGPLWERILGLMAQQNLVARTHAATQTDQFTAAAPADAKFLTSLDRLLSEGINALGARRQQSIYRASEAQRWIIRILIVNTGIGALLCVLGLWFARKWVVQPVGVLKQATAQLRQGDFNLQISLPQDDEMGRLGSQITQMATQIRRLQEQLVDRERQSAASDMLNHLEEYMQGPLSEIHALATQSAANEPQIHEVSECQERMAETVSRFEHWLHELKASLVPAKSDPRPAAISDVVSDVLTAVRPTLERHQVHAVTDLDPAIKDVPIDRLQFEQALIALVTNAAEASEAGQVVRIVVRSFSEANGCWELRVEDEGSGISPELMEKIFLPFFTTKRDGNGIGLGLVKAIIHQHGGELRVDSEPGKGSRFTIRMPGMSTAK